MFLVVVLPLVFLITVVPILIMLYGITRWQTETAKTQRRLEATRGQIGVRTFAAEEIEALPEPVKRYFQTVLTPSQPVVAVAEIGQTGEMRLDLEREDWTGLAAEQTTFTERPGFTWDARVRRAPGVQVFVRDSYIAGEGALKAALFGLLPVANQKDSETMARAELARFLAEAPWYPTKLLPSQGVRWTAIDDGAARATLSDGELEVSAIFSFDEDGVIRSVRSEDRSRMEGDRLVATPWEGRFWGYEPKSGMRIPTQAEAAWVTPEGSQPYWRGRVADILYKFAP
ncbi:hypothetical protein G3480_09135 [Thiorhodococcus mannitoliphagus]|uniref:Uncharacterized protein n=1 Tax=Thiorhodococcus mannitoliphagus TaxID=329406 RepID=A0A6P1DSE2_9GAMM|nr:DUF6544 family protein [Thiorhodococcus mannitoliphagus]NEX20470.1 hypothetical protein [Thiorhodococcus mannitoliphagus]